MSKDISIQYIFLRTLFLTQMQVAEMGFLFKVTGLSLRDRSVIRDHFL